MGALPITLHVIGLERSYFRDELDISAFVVRPFIEKHTLDR